MGEQERETLELVDRRIHEILDARGIDDLDTAIIMAKLRNNETWRDRLSYRVSFWVIITLIGGMIAGFVQIVKTWVEYLKIQ